MTTRWSWFTFIWLNTRVSEPIGTSTYGPLSRGADGKTPRCENPVCWGINATASEDDVNRFRSLLDLSELGGVLMSIASGES